VKTAIIIPARHASSRLPGKPLLRQTGKYLIQHVYERAVRVPNIDTVIVATDDPRIEAAVRSFGGTVAMTRRDHPTGTDRVAEVARGLAVDAVINVQGDEPLVEPATLELLVRLLHDNAAAPMATLGTPIRSLEQWQNPNCVKVVTDEAGRALYFSRSPIPFVRDCQPDFAARPARFLQHLGVYAYRKEFLLQMSSLRPSALEQSEKLEQLRVLAAGYAIQLGIVGESSIGVDTYDDYQRFVQIYRQRQGRAAA